MNADIPKIVSIIRKGKDAASCVGVDIDGKLTCLALFVLPEYEAEAVAFTERLNKLAQIGITEQDIADTMPDSIF